ncbi:Bug family tripartite tricarboxylate transporter substrate binding protein [Ramlibacter sp.]|uniref:Bug family tripartite tricarboxylate transporter substrate binding protein n=1 Tax=Ramlibacter sp. TaxID=1917967 RepID=UPI003D13D2EE
MRATPLLRGLSILCLGMLSLAATVQAQSPAPAWPTRPGTVVQGYPAGSAIDIVTRHLAAHLQKTTGQTFIAEVKTGALGNIAAQYVARAKPDGSTILLTANATHAANIHLFKNLGFDPVKDFVPVTTLHSLGFLLLINPARVPVTNVAGLLEHIKNQNGKASYGTGSASARVASELLLQIRGDLKATNVPYKGSSQAMSDLMSGQLDFIFADPGSALGHIRAGTLRALAVTNKERVPCAPDVPTMSEAGVPGYDLTSWFAVFLPAGTPQPIATRLATLANEAFQTDEGKAIEKNLCLSSFPGSPASLARLVETDTAKWGQIIKRAGIEAQ